MNTRAIAPCRADLAGGTLDIWPIGLLHPGAVTVNVAIPVFVEVDVTPIHGRAWLIHDRPEADRSVLGPDDRHENLAACILHHLKPSGGIRLEVRREPPMGSGLGGSSVFGCAMAQAVVAHQGRTMNAEETVAIIRDLEARLLGTATGSQDHWAAMRGGATALHCEPGGDRLEALPSDPEFFADRLTVFFTGITHHSGMVNWQVIRRRLDGDPDTTRAFEAIAEAARRCREALLAQDPDSTAAAIDRDWQARRTLAPEVCPDELTVIERAARTAGASAFKACGAGGGGSVLVWHPPEHREAVRAALTAAAPSGRLFDPGIVRDGCIVTTEESAVC
jgi:D-glycero-alpha-D-manno-heptose-7-phosphate kinase